MATRARAAVGGVLATLAATCLVSCTAAKPPGPPTYYVSPAGSDVASGTSPATAWRTLRRANQANLHPGDRLLLQGGRRFTGQLRFGQTEGGNPAKPIVVGSYGKGRATIVNASDAAIVIVDTAGIDIGDLVLVGEHKPAVSGGITLYNDLPGNRKLAHVVISHVDVSGFANGISVGGANGASGFEHVRITDSVLHDNLDNGLLTYGPPFNSAAPSYAHSDIEISHVAACRNAGNPADLRQNSGSGLVLGSVSGASVTWSVAYQNGGRGGGRYQGPQGIWTYDSTKVVIEHNLSYHNHTGNFVDGGGFDLDQNTSDSYLQYNLSYGNDGAGYIIYTGQKNWALTGNVVRFNISSGDARKWTFYAGITVIGRVSDTAIYQNTVIGAPRRHPDPAFALRLGRGLRRITVRNNIFATYQPGPIVVSTEPLRPATARLQGNDYYSARSPWSVRWGTVGYYSLGAWRGATGQETLSHRGTGFDVAPGFSGAVLGLKIVSADAIAREFGLRPASPLVGAGLDLLRLFGQQVGPTDYTGRPLPPGKLNVGAG